MKNLLMVAVAAVAFTSVAQAQGDAFTGAYAGVQLGLGNAKVAKKASGSTTNYNAQAFGANAMFGYGQLFDNLYVGGEILIGQDQDDKLLTETTTSKFKPSMSYGLNGRFGYLVAQKAVVYASLAALYGESKITTRNAAGVTTAEAKKKGFAFVPGIGTEMALTDSTSLRLDYTYQMPKTLKEKNAAGAENGTKYEVSKSTFKVGVAYHF